MPTVMVTIVQATFVLATFVHIRNISAVTDLILTKLFVPNFWQALIFLHTKFCGPTFFGPKIFQIKIFFRSKISLDTKFCWRKVFLDTKLFSTLKFLDQIFFLTKFVLDLKLLGAMTVSETFSYWSYWMLSWRVI